MIAPFMPTQTSSRLNPLASQYTRPVEFSPTQLNPVHFGNQAYDGNTSEGDADKSNAQKTLSFTKPTPVRWVQKLVGGTLNRFVHLPLQGIKVNFPKTELAKLKALPANAGVVMCASHPDIMDGPVMNHVFDTVGKVPAGFLIASDAFAKLSWPRRKLYSWLGAVPVIRGKVKKEAAPEQSDGTTDQKPVEKSGNEAATTYFTEKVAEGGWGQLFPEGAIYYSRQVMPMEYGAIKMGVEAAVMVQEAAEKNGTFEKDWRPIMVQPYAHIYTHTNPRKMQKRMAKNLSEIEALPQIFGKKQDGELTFDRFRAVARRILDAKLERYGWTQELKTAEWEAQDAFGRGEKLMNKLMDDLETRYLGKPSEGYVRRRAMNIRIKIYDKLQNKELPSTEKKALKEDIQKTMDAITLVSFSKDYLDKHNDLEMWGEFLRRFRDSVGLSDGAFGPREVSIKLLDPINMHALAKHFRTLTTDADRKAYLFELTENLRGTLQTGIDELTREKRSKTETLRPAPINS